MIDLLKNKKDIWFVGGYVRDLLLGKETKDIDLVIRGNAKSIASDFANKSKGSFVVLDDFNKIYRVITGGEIYDFSKMQGKDIFEDLGRRDFTINSIALPVEHSSTSILTGIIDPFKGYSDLKHKIIRCISERNFIDDPLRLLRAYRFSGQLKFKVEKNTESFIKKHSVKLKNVSAERIQSEIFLILQSKNSYFTVLKIYDSGLLGVILPELTLMKNEAKCYYGKMGLLSHSFKTLKVLENFYDTNFKKIFPKHYEKINRHLDENISRILKRRTLLKLAVLLHDVGKPLSSKKIDGRLRFFGHEDTGSDIIGNIGKRLKISKDEIRYLKILTKHHMRLGNLTSASKLTDKAVWRYFRDLGNDAIDLIVLSVSDAYTYPESKIRNLHKTVANKLLNRYYLKKEKVVPEKLLNGSEIMKILKIPEGPLVGKILHKLEEAQVTKRVKTKEEAKKFIKNICKNMKKIYNEIVKKSNNL